MANEFGIGGYGSPSVPTYDAGGMGQDPAAVAEDITAAGQRIADIQSLINQLLAEIAGLESQLAGVMAEMSGLDPSKPEDQARLQQLQARLQSIQSQIASKKGQLQQAEGNLRTAEAELQRLQRQMEAVARQNQQLRRQAEAQAERARQMAAQARQMADEMARMQSDLDRTNEALTLSLQVLDHANSAPLADDERVAVLRAAQQRAIQVLALAQAELADCCEIPPDLQELGLSVPVVSGTGLPVSLSEEEELAVEQYLLRVDGGLPVQLAEDGRPLGISEQVWNTLPAADRDAVMSEIETVEAAAEIRGVSAADPVGSNEYVEVRALDISHWQGNISQSDLDAWAAAGYNHVVVGTSNHTEYGDFSQQQLQALTEDGRFTVDVYYYLYPDERTGTIEEQIERAVAKVGDWPVGRFWIDVENNPDRETNSWGLSPTEMQDRMRRAVSYSEQLLAEAGRDDVGLGIYTGTYFWRDQLGDTDEFKDLPLWYAHWDDDFSMDSYGSSVPAVGGWDQPLAKQVAGTTRVPGASVGSDLNVMYIPRAQWEAVHGPFEGDVLVWPEGEVEPGVDPEPPPGTGPVDPEPPPEEVINPELEALLQDHPEIQTNQDLINHFWYSDPNRQGWGGLVQGCNEYGISWEPLIADRQGNVFELVYASGTPPTEPAPPVAGDFDTLLGLQRGDETDGADGNPIAVLHDFLLGQGYFDASIRDNVGYHKNFGPLTENAVRQFQAENGIPMTGTIDETTVTAMEEPRPRPEGVGLAAWRAYGDELGLATGPYQTFSDGSARQDFDNGYVALTADGVRYVRRHDGTDIVPPTTGIGTVTTAAEAEQFFLTQWGPTAYNDPPSGSDIPWGSNDCGPTAVAMALSAEGLLEHPTADTAYLTIDAVRDACLGYDSTKSVLTGETTLRRGVESYGGTLTDRPGNMDALDEALARGNPVILGGSFWDAWGEDQRSVGNYLNSKDPGGHWVTVFGKTAEGNYIVGDSLVRGGPIEVTAGQMGTFFQASAATEWVDVLEVENPAAPTPVAPVEEGEGPAPLGGVYEPYHVAGNANVNGRLGMHWSSTLDDLPPAERTALVSEMKSMGVGYCTLLVDVGGAQRQAATIQELQAAGITPVVRLYTSTPPDLWSEPQIAEMVETSRQLSQMGVELIQVGNEPNHGAETHLAERGDVSPQEYLVRSIARMTDAMAAIKESVPEVMLGAAPMATGTPHNLSNPGGFGYGYFQSQDDSEAAPGQRGYYSLMMEHMAKYEQAHGVQLVNWVATHTYPDIGYERGDNSPMQSGYYERVAEQYLGRPVNGLSTEGGPAPYIGGEPGFWAGDRPVGQMQSSYEWMQAHPEATDCIWPLYHHSGEREWGRNALLDSPPGTYGQALNGLEQNYEAYLANGGQESGPLPSGPSAPPEVTPPIGETGGATVEVYDGSGQARDWDWLQQTYPISIEPADVPSGSPSYGLVGVEEHTQGQSAFSVRVLDADGNPVPGVSVRWSWPDGEVIGQTEMKSDGARAEFGMGAYYYPDRIGPDGRPEAGPYSMQIVDAQGNPLSPKINGLGMVAGTNHNHVNLVMRLGADAGTQPVGPPDNPVAPAPPVAPVGSPDDRLPPPTKGSKLGVHFLSSASGPTADLLMSANPAVVKFLAGEGSDRITEYKQNNPNGTVVLRTYVSPEQANYSTADDPTRAAEDFWAKMQPGLSKVDPGMVDWLEGPNELDNFPDWYHDYQAAEWVAGFWDRLADLMHEAGYKPLVGSVATGNPALAGEQGPQNFMQPLADVMKSKDYPIGWSYHGYSSNLSYDETGEESYFSLRYRRTIEETGLQGFPLVMTEGGQDVPTGWRDRGVTESEFFNWLKWYDEQLCEDPEVVGVTLFQLGNMTDWRAFDVGPVVDELAEHIVESREEAEEEDP